MQQSKRWITAVIVLPFLCLFLVKGSTGLLAILLSVVSILTMREYFKIVFSSIPDEIPLSLKFLSYFVAIALSGFAFKGSMNIILLILYLNIFLASVIVLAHFSLNASIIEIIAKQVLGIVYIPLSLSFLVFIRGFENGIYWIFWLLILVFANDTGAYYIGSYMGKRPLAPKISPNKTIEGSIAGIVSSILVGFIFCILFFNDFSMALKIIPCAVLMAIAGQIGDLFESVLKRAGKIKDSGRILPGHGGMLDRIDGLLFAIPVLYVYLALFL